MCAAAAGFSFMNVLRVVC